MIYEEICMYCKHLHDQSDKRQKSYKCKAFPNDVPREIYQGKYDHRNRYPNDSGITFELKTIAYKDKAEHMFRVIEGARKEALENPMKTNPLSYDWSKTQPDDDKK